MNEALVINTGPLIALAKAEVLDVCGQLSISFFCPMQVWRELDEGVQQGYVAPTRGWGRTAKKIGHSRVPVHW